MTFIQHISASAMAVEADGPHSGAAFSSIYSENQHEVSCQNSSIYFTYFCSNKNSNSNSTDA